jgi:hypothetical protein
LPLLFEYLFDLLAILLAGLGNREADGLGQHAGMLLVPAHKIATQMLLDSLIDPRHPALRPLVLLGFARLLRSRLGLLLGSATINRIARMREIILGQLLKDFVGLCVGALTLPPLFE